MYLQKVHLYRVVLRRRWQLDTVWSVMLYNHYQKVRHVLWFSSCGIRQPSFLLAHRWDWRAGGGGVACLPVSHLLCWAGAWPVGGVSPSAVQLQCSFGCAVA